MSGADDPLRGLSAADEELLLDVLSGVRAASDPDVLARLQADPGLERRLARLRSTERALRDEGTPPSEEGEEPADEDERLVRRILVEAGALRPRPWRQLGPWALAAALLVVALLGWRARSGPREPAPRVILSDEAVPVGEVPRFERFHAPLELLPGERLRIRIHADDPGSDPDHVVLESPELSETTWTLTDAERTQLAGLERIRWTYRTLGGVERTGEHFARRSSPR